MKIPLIIINIIISPFITSTAVWSSTTDTSEIIQISNHDGKSFELDYLTTPNDLVVAQVNGFDIPDAETTVQCGAGQAINKSGNCYTLEKPKPKPKLKSKPQAKLSGDKCLIADLQNTSLNVRNSPNGDIINRLKNGRTVYIQKYKNDSKGRPWGYAVGIFNQDYREWGWVFMASVNCVTKTQQQTALPAIQDIPDPIPPGNVELTRRDIRRIEETCIATESDGSILNVRKRPNGRIINKLKNGTKIYLTKFRYDDKDRLWGFARGHVSKAAYSTYEKLGWVFYSSLDCQGGFHP